MQTVDGIINEQTVNFVGKDGFFWWVGEVEDNEDPLLVGRVKCRVLNYYTDPRGGSSNSMPTEDLPWATVLQGTDQAGNDGQGESSGQLQPGSIVMGFFLDGENAQMPLIIGVLRTVRGDTTKTKKFLFAGDDIPDNTQPNASQVPVGEPNTITAENREVLTTNTVTIPNDGKPPGGPGAPANIGNAPGVNGSSNNAQKPRAQMVPTAAGTGGPWQTLETKLTYLVEDIADTAGNLIKSDNGDFIDVVENKVITLDKIVGKAKNFLSAVFAQVVSAMRMQLDELVQQIESAGFLASFTGIPGATFTVISSAISAILSAICGLDSKLVSFLQSPVDTIVGLVEGVIEGLIDKAAAVVQGVQDIIDSILCTVQSIIDDILGVISMVKDIVSTVQDAMKIIETWQKGSEIFAEGFDLVQNGISSLTGLLSFFLALFDFGCDRKATGGEDEVGWYPFFGTTYCGSGSGPGNGGKSRGDCGDSSRGGGGGFIDTFLQEADPYLTSAKNFLSGAYEMNIGTPGRQATIKKDASGKTTFSVKGNNAALSEYKAKAEAKKQGKELSDSELKKYKKDQSGSESDQGNMIADHTSYPGNHTQEVHGDDCNVIDGDYCRTVEGDYRLKISGDCHIEVGGGFFMNAQGAPKQTDSKGNEGKEPDKVQKHTINMGSDLDLNVAGATLKLNATNAEFGFRDLKMSGSSFENSYKTQTHSPGEFVINAGNAITMNCTTLTQNVNFLTPLGIASGYFCNVGGPINFLQIPAVSGGLPPYAVTTPGPFTVTCAAAGATFTVGAGAFNVAVAAGAIAMTASAAISATAGGAMTLTAGPLMQLSAIMIKLN